MRLCLYSFFSIFLGVSVCCGWLKTENSASATDGPAIIKERKRSVDFRFAGVSDLNGGFEEWFIDENNTHLLEASYCSEETRTRVEQYIATADRVIEREETPNADLKDLRVVFESDELKQGRFAIMTNNNAKCIELINAPTLELALDFEKFRHPFSR
jgi:hypothetical protein